MDAARNKVIDCFKYNASAKTLTKIANINEGRSAFGIVSINQYIYVISGSQGIKGCERYDITTNVWEKYADLPYDLIAVTATKYKERYLIAIGGINYILY